VPSKNNNRRINLTVHLNFSRSAAAADNLTTNINLTIDLTIDLNPSSTKMPKVAQQSKEKKTKQSIPTTGLPNLLLAY
jgi:hypothetical protein